MIRRPNAGRDLLDRLRKLERVAEAARVIEMAIRYQPISQQGGCYLLAREDIEDLREALAALEGVEDA